MIYYFKNQLFLSSNSKEDRKSQPAWSTIEEHKIFSSCKELPSPRSVLLEGEAGVGKTAFVQRWCYQWATRLGIDMLHGLSLILVLQAQKIKGCIEDEIKNLFPVGKRDEMYCYIENHQENCLIVVEALDELRGSDASVVESLVRGEILPNAKVLVTGRTYQMPLPHTLFDRVVKLEGLEKDKVDIFIERSVCDFQLKLNKYPVQKEGPVEGDTSTIKTLIPFQMLRVPLLCLIICYAFLCRSIENITDKAKVTRTALFSCLQTNLMVREKSPTSKDDMDKLQKLALYCACGISDENITDELLSKYELNDSVLKYGLLVKSYSYSFTEEVTTYSFLHEQVLEFLAAKALLKLPNKQKKSLIILLCKNKKIGVLRFLAGLTEQKTDIQFLVSVFVTFQTNSNPQILDAAECSIGRCSKLFNMQKKLDEFARDVKEALCVGVPTEQTEAIQFFNKLPQVDEIVVRDISHQCPFLFSSVLQGEERFNSTPLSHLNMILSDGSDEDMKQFNVYHQNLPVKR